MSQNPFQPDIDKIRSWVQRACEISLEHFGNTTFEHKEDGSVVTPADRLVEEFLRDKITNHYPQHRVLGEEFGGDGCLKEKSPLWIIDPIDGTEAYLTSLPTFAFSLAIYQDGACIYANLSLPYMNQCLELLDDQVYFDGKPLYEPGQFLPSIMASSDYSSCFPVPAQIKTRCLGSICFHAAYLARGLCRAVLVNSATLWDVAAAFPILQNLGFEILDRKGHRLSIGEDNSFLEKPFFLTHRRDRELLMALLQEPKPHQNRS